MPTAVRIADATGSSRRSWDAAVADAVRSGRADIAAPIAVEVGRLWADLDARGAIRLYRASVKIAYRQPLVAPAVGAAAKRPRKSAART